MHLPDPSGLELLLTHDRWIHRLARALVRDDPDGANDVAQDARMALWLRPPTAPDRTKSWLSTVVHNLVRNRARERHTRQLALDRLAATPSEDIGDKAALAALRGQLAAQVLELPRLWREVITLRYLDDLSAADIARKLGVPAGTVRWRLKQALDRLRENLDDRHDGGRSRRVRGLAPLAGTPPAPTLRFAPLVVALAGAAVILWPRAPNGELARGREDRAAATTAVLPMPSSSVLVGMVLPALAKAAVASDTSHETPSIADRISEIASQPGPDRLPVVVDDHILRALDQLIGTTRARANTRAILARLRDHEPMLRDVFARLALPYELAAVAFIESGFDQDARSDTARTSGLWQLTPAAARAQGLTVTADRDDRLDPRLATEAAARILDAEHTRLGDWNLALAAYNQGPGAVARAVEEVGTRDASTLQSLGWLEPYRALALAAALVLRDPTLAN